MKTKSISLGIVAMLLTVAFIPAAETPPPIEWQRSYGGSDGENFGGLLPATDGGFYLALPSASGVSGNRTTPSYGGVDAWLVRADADGVIVWDRAFGGSDRDYVFNFVPAGDGGFFLCAESSSSPSGNKTSAHFGSDDAWVVKVDANGNKLWDRSFGGSDQDECVTVLPLSDGNFLLVGNSRSGPSGNKTSSNLGAWDFYLIKMDSNGNQIWDQTFGGSGDDLVAAVVPTPDGGFLLGGTTSSGVSGNKTSPSYGQGDFWLVKIDANGNKLWDRTFGDSDDDGMGAIAPTADGGFLLGGSSLVKVDTNGNRLWEKVYGSFINSIVATDDSGFLLAGIAGGGYGFIDYWVRKVDASGNMVWDTSFGGTDFDDSATLAPAPTGGYFLSGRSRSGISGNKSTANFGVTDGWVIKLFGLPPCSNCPPRFTLQPGNQLVLPGTNVTLATTVASVSPIQYQWRFEGTNILDATNASYSFDNVSLTNGHGIFSVIVSNEFGQVTSTNAFVFVRIRPGIVTQPVTQTVLQGQNATFTCVATGAPPIFYRWSGPSITPFTNTTGIFVFSNALVSIANGIRCHAINAAGNVQSANVSLFVIADFDRDGMADTWEAQYGLNTNNAADASLDFDQDGMSNRDEYASATDPMDAGSVLKLAILRDGGVLLQFTAQSNLTYSVQFRTSLAAAAPWQTLSNVASASTTRTLDILDLAAPTGGRFYRIRTPLESDR